MNAALKAELAAAKRRFTPTEHGYLPVIEPTDTGCLVRLSFVPNAYPNHRKGPPSWSRNYLCDVTFPEGRGPLIRVSYVRSAGFGPEGTIDDPMPNYGLVRDQVLVDLDRARGLAEAFPQTATDAIRINSEYMETLYPVIGPAAAGRFLDVEADGRSHRFALVGASRRGEHPLMNWGVRTETGWRSVGSVFWTGAAVSLQRETMFQGRAVLDADSFGRLDAMVASAVCEYGWERARVRQEPLPEETDDASPTP